MSLYIHAFETERVNQAWVGEVLAPEAGLGHGPPSRLSAPDLEGGQNDLFLGGQTALQRLCREGAAVLDELPCRVHLTPHVPE